MIVVVILLWFQFISWMNPGKCFYNILWIIGSLFRDTDYQCINNRNILHIIIELCEETCLPIFDKIFENYQKFRIHKLSGNAHIFILIYLKKPDWLYWSCWSIDLWLTIFFIAKSKSPRYVCVVQVISDFEIGSVGGKLIFFIFPFFFFKQRLK